MKIDLRFCSTLALATSVLTLASLSGTARAQTAPVMAQVPFVYGLTGNANGSLVAPCSSSTDIKTTGGNHYGDGCPASEAIVTSPYSASVDSYGNVYFADEGDDYVRVIYNGGAAVAAMIEAANATASVTPQVGDIYALAGGLTGKITNNNAASQPACNNSTSSSAASASDTSGDGCPATETYLDGPYGAAVDSAGDVFIADRGGSKIHVVYAGGAAAAALITLENPSVTSPQIGYMYLIAGGSSGYVDGVLATSAKLDEPGGLAVDASGNLYIADTGNSAIREIHASTGIINTIGGKCSSSSCTKLTAAPTNGAAAVGTEFNTPQSVGVDASGNVYVADDSGTQGNNSSVYPSVRVIYAGGANNQAAGLICLENGSSGYNTISGSCSASTLVAGDVYAIAGTQTNVSASSGSGSLAAAAQFEKLIGLAVGPHGNVFVSDYASPSVIAEINAETGYMVFLQSDGQSTNGQVSVGSYCAPGQTTGPTATDAFGDGCPGPQSYAHHIEGGMAVDASGNIYFSDTGNNAVRELKFDDTFPSTAVGSTATAQMYAYTLLPTSSTATITLGTPTVTTEGQTSGAFADAGTGDTCTNGTTLYGSALSSTSTAQNTTCVLNVKFAPTDVGTAEGAVTINGSSGPAVTSYVSGVGLGALPTIDPGTASTLGSGSSPAGVAVDVAGNVYIDYAGTGTITSTGGALAATAGSGLSNPYQIAIDGSGDVYVADSGNNRIAEFAAGSSTATTVPVTGLSSPEGLALDGLGDMFIADTGNARVVEQPNGNGEPVTLGSGFKKPVAVAVDASGNVYVADSELGDVVKIASGTGAQTTLVSGADPVSVAVDPAGDVYYADGSNDNVVEVPVSGSNTVVASGFTTPVGVALDANGNLYVADSSATGISEFNRTVSTQVFPNLSTELTATLTNAGNANFVETNSTFTQTDSTDFNVTTSSSGGCDFSNPLAAGTICTVNAQFTPTAAGSLSDTVTFSGNGVNASAVTLQLSGQGIVAIGTTTTLGTLSPTSPSYGQSVQIGVTVAADSGSTTPDGSVVFTVDGTAQAPMTLTNGTATLTLPSLSAGQHTISATYSGGSDFSGSTTTTPATFTVTPLPLTATTNSITVTVGQTIPAITGTLTGMLPADANNVAAVFSTTATSSSAPGTYPITVTLTGSAASDYTVTLTGSPTVTIGKATTTTGLTASVPSINEGGSITFTATVTSSGGTPTGSVTFYSGTTSIGTATLSSGVATLNYSGFSAGDQSVTATYAGNTDYATSTSTAVSVDVLVPVVNGTLSASTVDINAGQTGTVTMTLTAVGGYTGTASYSCFNLPQDMSCSFSPSSSTFSSSALTSTTTLTISTSAKTSAALEMQPLPGSRSPRDGAPLMALCLPAALLGWFGVRKRKIAREWQRRMAIVTLLVAGLSGLALISGCGSSSTAGATTPAGSYNINVAITAGTVQQVPLTVVVK